jgi:hypothetical protein
MQPVEPSLSQRRGAEAPLVKRELQGKILGCWCVPQASNGDVLAQVADDGSG